MPNTDRGPAGGGISNGEMLGLGLYIAVAVAVPLLAGWRLGDALGASTIGVVAGLVVGTVAAGWIVYVRLRRYW